MTMLASITGTYNRGSFIYIDSTLFRTAKGSSSKCHIGTVENFASRWKSHTFVFDVKTASSV